MKTRSVRAVAIIAFCIACLLNLAGCICNASIARMVKPALMPLLALVTLICLKEGNGSRRQKCLLLAAQLCGFAGDVLLLSGGNACFIAGMAAFLVGHICYILLFGGMSLKDFSPRLWAMFLTGIIALLVLAVKSIGINGPLLIPMLVYGFALLLLTYSGLAGTARFGGIWRCVLYGGLLFTFSDSLIAMGLFGKADFALRSFMVMFTYLAAQTLLAIAGISLIKKGSDSVSHSQ